MSRGDSKKKAIMAAAAPKPPLAIPPHSKLWGFPAFSRETKKMRGASPRHLLESFSIFEPITN